MTISEQSRHALFVRLESVLGEEAALTLMEHLPPVGWADVATKRDLDQLHVLTQRDIALGAAEIRDEMHQLETSLREEIHSSMAAQTRTLVFTVLGSMATMGALTISAARLA
jgi:hypothetical protein